MTLLNLFGYLADAWILSSYAVLARSGRPSAFHMANAIGCIPLIAIEITQHAYPVLPLTGTFGVLGMYGAWKERND